MAAGILKFRKSQHDDFITRMSEHDSPYSRGGHPRRVDGYVGFLLPHWHIDSLFLSLYLSIKQ